MESTPLQTCIPAGSSDLGQSAFKIMRSTNLMKMQRLNGAQQTERAYEKLREEMLGRKKAFEESVTDYKMSLIRAKEQKKKIQSDNSTYCRQQMGWKQDVKEKSIKENSEYDPEQVWNIEGPLRRK